MTTTPAPKGADIEQQRAEFEALARQRGLNTARTKAGDRCRWHVTGVAWEFWLSGMREESGSGTSTSQGAALKRYAVDYVNQELEERADGELVMFQDVCGGNSGAAPGDALDAARLDFLDTNVHRFRMGWQIGAAPVGNLSVRTIIMGGLPIREAIDLAISAIAASTTQDGEKQK